MSDVLSPGNFRRWQDAQRELHALAQQLRERQRLASPAGGPPAPDGLDLRVRQLAAEVDRLLPLAMEELESQVRVLMARRPRLGDR